MDLEALMVPIKESMPDLSLGWIGSLALSPDRFT
jgi:hypothetical protein